MKNLSLWVPVVFACKRVTFGAELQLPIGPRPHLSFSASNTAWLAPELLVSICPSGFCMQNSDFWSRITTLYGPSPHQSFSAYKTATLAYELLVSIVPSPHLWFLYAKQRLVDQHTSLYGHQTSPVVLCIQTSVIRTRNTSFYGFHPSSVILYMKTATLGLDLQVCLGPRPHLSLSARKTAWIASE